MLEENNEFSLYTILFVLFGDIGERGPREAPIFFFPDHYYPFARAVNKSPAVYFLSPALDGL